MVVYNETTIYPLILKIEFKHFLAAFVFSMKLLQHEKIPKEGKNRLSKCSGLHIMFRILHYILAHTYSI